ncbi:MAG: molybdenum cofactor synthesis domain-containing protein [Bacillota bacterium]|nr:MAG: molybdenum cofactor synthesis domain-containing protein [Bacillota bacterium]
MPKVELVPGHGIQGDAHAGPWHRQVSLLAAESIEKMQELGLKVFPGAFAENITTRNLLLPALPLGTRLTIGDAVVSVTQIGKVCHTRCAIYHQAGDCVMPREGIFVEVLRGGVIAPGDGVVVWPRFRALVITLSDRCSRGETADESGPALLGELSLLGAEVTHCLLPDDSTLLAQTLIQSSDNNTVDLIVTTGGTGLSPRDITPETTLRCIEREVPGIAEEMRRLSLMKTPHAMLSRAVAGIRGQTLIVNLPGSKKGARECFDVFRGALPHALEVLTGNTLDCGR